MEEAPIKKCEGRRKREPPKDAADAIREAAAQGASQKELARHFGCGVEIFARWLKDYPELREAFDEGRDRERRVLHNRVFEIATKGTGKEALIACFFLLKSRHGYRDNAPETPANTVSVNFQIPGAKPFDPDKVIENEPSNRAERLSATPAIRA